MSITQFYKGVPFKMCKGCLQDKDFDEYYRNRKMSDGYENECKECVNRRRKINDRLNPEARQERQVRYNVNRGRAMRKKRNQVKKELQQLLED